MRRLMALLFAGLVLVAGLVLAGCGWFDDDADEDEPAPPDASLATPQGPEDGLRVTVIGDSITALGEEPLREELADTRLSITGVPGFRLGQFDLDDLDDHDPDVLVIAL